MHISNQYLQARRLLLDTTGLGIDSPDGIEQRLACQIFLELSKSHPETYAALDTLRIAHTSSNLTVQKTIWDNVTEWNYTLVYPEARGFNSLATVTVIKNGEAQPYIRDPENNVAIDDPSAADRLLRGDDERSVQITVAAAREAMDDLAHVMYRFAAGRNGPGF